MAIAQTPWILPGNSGVNPSSDYLGAQNNAELVLRTHDTFRFRLNKTETYGTLGGFTSIPAHGFGLITPNNSFLSPGPGPFSRLHLAEGSGDNTQSLGYRPWMRNGVSFTGNADQGYMGQKFTYDDPLDHTSGELEDYTDMVIQWSDNPGKALNDKLRFIFTSEYQEAATGANSLEGLEGMRLYPVSSSEVNVGIGDFYAAGDEPDERLDVVTGNVRIRELPDAGNEMDTEDKFVVTDADGVLGWRAVPNDADCKWTLLTGNNIATAYTSNPGCPQDDDMVGIGFDPSAVTPLAKLEVKTDDFSNGIRVVNTISAASSTGLNVTASGGTSSTTGTCGILTNTTQSGSGANSCGLFIDADGAGGGGSNLGAVIQSIVPSGSAAADNWGLKATVTDNNSSADNWGAKFDVEGTGSSSINMGVAVEVTANGAGSVATGVSSLVDVGSGGAGKGVYTEVTGSNTNAWSFGVNSHALVSGLVNMGVYGRALNGTENYGVRGEAAVATNSWAGWFEGKAKVNGYLEASSFNYPCDSELKMNIESYAGALAAIAAIEPRTYNYNTGAFAQMNLPAGEQIGLLAQEVQAVLPHAVHASVHPPQYDEEGQMVSEAVPHLRVDLGMLVPVLMAGIREQQIMIAAQEGRLNELEEALSNCCSSMGGSGERADGPSGPTDLVTGNERALTIQPNPFNERTTLYYTLERNGRMQLMANSADGKQLRVLQEANLEAGQYQHEWQTNALSPGIYYVTLLLDGEPIVKKAVKVAR